MFVLNGNTVYSIRVQELIIASLGLLVMPKINRLKVDEYLPMTPDKLSKGNQQKIQF